MSSGGDDGGTQTCPNPPNPPSDSPLTCDDGEAGMAGKEYTASLVRCKDTSDTETTPSLPGGITDNTPCMNERVRQALANARNGAGR